MDGGNASKMVYDDVLSTVFKYQFPDQTGNKVIFEVTKLPYLPFTLIILTSELAFVADAL